MKIAFIVTSHWSSNIRPYGQEILTRLINSLHHVKYPYTLYVVDNQSEFKLNIPETAKYIRINNQFEKRILEILKLIDNVTKIKTYKRDNSETSELEPLMEQMDQVIYKAYGLNKEEISLIEGK